MLAPEKNELFLELFIVLSTPNLTRWQPYQQLNAVHDA